MSKLFLLDVCCAIVLLCAVLTLCCCTRLTYEHPQLGKVGYTYWLQNKDRVADVVRTTDTLRVHFQDKTQADPAVEIVREGIKAAVQGALEGAK